MNTFRHSIFLDRFKPGEYSQISEMLNEIVAEGVSVISNFKHTVNFSQINSMDDAQLTVIYNKLLIIKNTGLKDMRDVCKKYPRALSVDDDITKAYKNKVASLPVSSKNLSPDFAKKLFDNRETFIKVGHQFIQKVSEETKEYGLLYKIFSDNIATLPQEKMTAVRKDVYRLMREITSSVVSIAISTISEITLDVRSQLLDEMFVRLLALDLSGVA